MVSQPSAQVLARLLTLVSGWSALAIGEFILCSGQGSSRSLSQTKTELAKGKINPESRGRYLHTLSYWRGARQPNCRGHSESELSQNLVFRGKDISNINGVIFSFLEVVKFLFFQ